MIKWKNDLNGVEFLNTFDERLVYKEDFKSFFGDLDSYDKLIFHEKITEGWKKILNKWKEQGLIE